MAYNSFKEFFENNNIELTRNVEVAFHSDENIANNRLFVWNFEEGDLEEFVGFFEAYKDGSANDASRTVLSGNIMRKMNAMLREGYNPVECMLYASKVVNMRLQNDNNLQEILAERIRDIYIKQESDTIAVIDNMIKMWEWVPQIKVVITAIGLIGDNEELLDKVLINYADDPYYKDKAFHAFIQNKNLANLERALKIVMNLQDSEEDNRIGRIFMKEVEGFGYEGLKIVKKYADNPGISKAGGRVLKKIVIKSDSVSSADKDDKVYRQNLANKSAKDDAAFKEFVDNCYEKYDDDAFFLCRFSRAQSGEFLKHVLEDEGIPNRERNTAVISLGILFNKGYSPAEALVDTCEKRGGTENAVMVANIIMKKARYADMLVEKFSSKKDYELSDLYRILNSSGLGRLQGSDPSIQLINSSLERQYRRLLENDDFDSLACLTSNIQIFWDKKLFNFLSRNMLSEMTNTLKIYAENSIDVPQDIIISIIETVVHWWNGDVEKAMFALYRCSNNAKVQDVSYKKLKERKIEAPK